MGLSRASVHLCSQGQETAALPQAHLSAEEVGDSETMTEPTSHHPQPHLGSSRQTGTGAAGGECQGLRGTMPAHILRKGWETEGRWASTVHLQHTACTWEGEARDPRAEEGEPLASPDIHHSCGWPKPSPEGATSPHPAILQVSIRP